MSLLRSQKMKYCHLICNDDSAWDILNEIGDLSAMHFVDPDPNLPLINRPFANYIKRCEEVELKLEFIREQCTKFDQEITKCAEYDQLLKHFKNILKDRALKEGKKDGKTYFHEMEEETNEQHLWLEEQLKHFENLTEKKNQLVEYKAVLINAQRIIGNNFFSQEQGGQGNMDITGLDFQAVLDARVSMNQIIGVIDANEALRFQRMIFRVTKGNCYTEISDIEWQEDAILDPNTLKPVEKKVFIILYPGGTMDIVKNKLNRICDSFSCNKFGFPQNQQMFLQKLKEIDEQKKDAVNLVEMTKHNLVEFLKTWAKSRPGTGCSKVEEQTMYIVKEKGLYHTLNLLKTDQKIYQGYAWIPKCDVEMVSKTIQDLGRLNPDLGGGQVRPQKKPDPSIEKPPTCFKLNEFTGIFQLITNTYGVPRYKEINPGLFSIMTFPFLFGVMFGDMAHGSLLWLFGTFLILKNESLKGTALGAFSQTRYFIFFMGFFATYCGFLYNDFLSLSFDFFGSCYEPTQIIECPGQPGVECYAYKTPGEQTMCNYPFGVDPIWAITANSISFMNSYKMKMAVIFGVLQMCMGIFLKGWNAISFKQPLDFIFEFLPQIIFMLCTFGYMDFMIIYKWFCNFQAADSMWAPSIITLLINMPLMMGAPGEVGDPYLYGNPDGSDQKNVQLVLLVTAVLMIPLMLIPKPIIVNAMNKKKSQQQPVFQGKRKNSKEIGLLNDQDNSYDNENNYGGIQAKSMGNDSSLEKELQASLMHGEGEEHAHEDHGFGELFVHQVIETIEFVLGSISNTASYLRLWALSLAHSQLADVFFANGIQPFISMGGVGGGIGLVFGFYVFSMITFGVLMCMDVMECFLHALRLHWVEFQNKFYKADGVAFVPFSFVSIMHLHNSSEL